MSGVTLAKTDCGVHTTVAVAFSGLSDALHLGTLAEGTSVRDTFRLFFRLQVLFTLSFHSTESGICRLVSFRCPRDCSLLNSDWISSGARS